MNNDSVNESFYHNGRYLGTLKVGSRDDIVPKDVRDLFHIRIGELLLLLADKDRGIAIQKMEGCDEAFKMAFQIKETK